MKIRIPIRIYSPSITSGQPFRLGSGLNLGIDLGIAYGSEIISDHHLGWCVQTHQEIVEFKLPTFFSHSVKLTVCHWKLVVGRPSLPFGFWPIFRGELAVKVTIYHLFTRKRMKPTLFFRPLLSWKHGHNMDYRLYQHRPQIAKTKFCNINVKNSVTSARSSNKIHCRFLGCLGEIGGPENRRNIWNRDWRPAMAPQQWHHVHSPKDGRHPGPPTIVHYNGRLRWQWHPAITPRPSTQLVVTSPNHSTLQWHPAMAPSTPPKKKALPPPHHSTQWHPAITPRPLSWPPQP